MESIGIRELKQNASQVLARVEAGESFVVTVQGRKVGRLVPEAKTRFVPAAEMMTMYDVPVDDGYWEDIRQARSESTYIDPWSRG